MVKKTRGRFLSIFIVILFIISSFSQTLAFAKDASGNGVHGKYYGKELASKEKVKEVQTKETKTEKPAKKPVTKKSKWVYEEKFNDKQEAKERRTLNSKTFKEGNGKYSTYVFTENINFKNSKGEIEEIDNTLIEDKNKKGTVYKNKANEFNASFPSKIEKNNPIKVEKDDTYIEMLPTEGDFSKSSTLDNSILYSDVLEGIDYQYTVNNSKVKEDIILNHLVDRNEFHFEIKTSGLTLKEEGGVIFAYDKKEKEPLWKISAPEMVDANGKSSINLKLSLDKRFFGNDRVIITADKDWLKAKDRAYPVKIDPTLWVHNAALIDNCVEDNHPDTITDNAYSYIGYDDGKTSGNLAEWGTYLGRNRTFVKFQLPTLPEGATVNYAALNMYRYTDYSSAERVIQLHSVNQDYDISGISWNNQPTSTSFETSTKITGNIGYVTWNIKNLVNQWYNGTHNYGVVLKYENEIVQCEVFRSNEYGNKDQTPYARIDYQEQGEVQIDNLVKPTINLRPVVKSDGQGYLKFLKVTADGLSKPKSKINYRTDPANGSFTGEVIADKDYIYPDLTQEPGTQPYNIKESNWQTDKAFTEEMIGFDTLYKITADATIELEEEQPPAEGGEQPAGPTPPKTETSALGESDSFQLYQAKFMDILPRIIEFYGITDQVTFRKDNNITKEIVKPGSILFIRNPKQNQGKPYNLAKLTDDDFLKFYGPLNGNARYCEIGFEPINLLTGNYYYTAEDISIPDIGGDFKITRTYNSKASHYNGPFGFKWDFNYNKYIAHMENGDIGFDRGDGSIIFFTKNSDGSYTAPVGEIYNLTELENGYKITEKDATTYYFMTAGLLTAIEDKNGNKTQFQYDENFSLKKIVSPSGKELQISCDSMGRITEITMPDGNSVAYEYDSKGNLISYTNAKGSRTDYNYDDKGRLVSFYDPKENRVINNIYDDSNRVVQQEDSKGSIIYIKYFNGYNETTDAKGNKTIYYYDSQFRKTKIVYPDGTSEEYTYDSENNVKTFKDKLGRTTTYEYDSNGNKTKETLWNGKVSKFTYNASNNMTSATDLNDNITWMDYNSKGNLIKVTRPGEVTTEYTYNEKGQLITSKDSEGKTTTYEYQGGDLVKITDPRGNSSSYYYNSVGKVITIEDPLGKLTRIAYSPSGERLNVLLPDGNTTEYGYDSSGNNTAIVDGKGNAVIFNYDSLDNMESVQDPLGNITSFKYDLNGNKIEEKNPKGGIIKYEYDSMNRLIKVIDQDSGVTEYIRDALGNITSIINPEGSKTTYEFNYDVNMPEKITSSIGQTVVNEYDPMGNLLKSILPDGNVKTYKYDNLYN